MVDQYRPSEIKKMKEDAKETRSPALYSELSKYYSSDRRTWGKCEKYANKAFECGGDPRSAYQLGYIYEKRLSYGTDLNISKGYENKMQKYYLLAMAAGVFEAHARLGAFYIEDKITFNGKSPLQLLEIAADHNHLVAIHNLVRWHPNVNMKFKWAHKRYEMTKKNRDIERLIRLVYEYQQPRQYKKLGHKIGIDTLYIIMENANIVRYKIVIHFCKSCNRRSKCIPLQCGDFLCHNCFFRLSMCPKCSIFF